MDADTIFLVLRVVVALGVVLAVLWILRRRLAKGSGKPAAGRPGARRAPLSLFGRAPQGPTAAVRGRHALGQKSSVAVVEFDGREFLLGVTEHGVTVLHQARADEEPELPPVGLPPVEPVETAAPEPAASEPAPTEATTTPTPDWAALFARELLAAQQAMTAATPVEPVDTAAPTPAAIPTPAPAPVAAHEPATVFAPRYARSTAPVIDADDEIDPASGLVPQPLPVRTVISGQFVAEVELMPLPTSAIPVVPAAAPATSVPAPAPAPAPTPAATDRPASSNPMLPITAMIPTITTPAASPLAGSILSPDTWRQTVDAFRQLR